MSQVPPMQAAIAALLGPKGAAPGAGAPSMGAAPTMAPPPNPLGNPPPLDTNVEPPAYDVAKDPGWRGVIDPNDHALRNFFNGISPEERELLRAWKMGATAPKTTPQSAGTI